MNAPTANEAAAGAIDPDEPVRGRLPRLTMIAWGLGPFGVSAVLSVIGAQFLLYLTDYLGLAAALAGTILFAAKMYDAFTDFAVGVASDNIDTPWGRRRPWLFVGTLVVAASGPLLFHIDLLDPAVRVGVAVAFVVLFYTGYSMFMVPHFAMSAEMTVDYQERTSIVSWLYLFGALSYVSGVSLAPLIMEWAGGGLRGFHAMAWVMAAFPLFSGLLCIAGTRNAPARRKSRKPRIPVGEWFGSMAGNRPLVVLVASKLLHYFSVACFTGGLVYFSLYVLRIGQMGMVISGATMTAGSLSGLYFFVAASRRFAKHRIYAFALAGMGLSALAFSLMGPTTSRAVFGGLCFVYGVFGAGLVMAQSMLPDVMDWDYKRTGLRREGAVSSLISAIGKTTPAFGSLVLGLLLSANGYVSGRPGAIQPQSAIRAIMICVSLIPGVFLILAAVMLYLFYDLTREKLGERPA